MSESLQSNSTFGQRFGKAVKRVLRVVLVLLVIAGIVALIYYGTPYVYQKFIQPVEKNSARITAIESAQSDEVTILKGQLADLQTRLLVAETGLTAENQKAAQLEGNYLALKEVVDDQTAQLTQIQVLQKALNALEVNMGTQEDNFSDLTSQVNDLKLKLSYSQAAGYLSRARIYLLQSNFGLAEQDIQITYTLLQDVKAEHSSGNVEVLDFVIGRLEAVVGYLPDFPIVAAADLEIAWQALSTGRLDIQPGMPTKTQSDATLTPTLENSGTGNSVTTTPSSNVTPTP